MEIIKDDFSYIMYLHKQSVKVIIIPKFLDKYNHIYKILHIHAHAVANLKLYQQSKASSMNNQTITTSSVTVTVKWSALLMPCSEACQMFINI